MLDRLLDWFGFGEARRGHLRREHRGDGERDRHSHAAHHSHGIIDPTIATTTKGIRAIKWSFAILAATALLQLAVVYFSRSVALLADTIHNIADAGTAIPLWIAFALARRKPTPTFTYGLGRVEDLAGLTIVLIILASALVAGYEAVDRLLHPRPILHLGWLALAGLVGFVGNEAVALLRIKVGRDIDSAALVADGYHARTDGLTSLAVVVGAIGVWLGFPSADPIVGLAITAAILGIVWQSGKAVLTRSLDGVEPRILAALSHIAAEAPGVVNVEAARARWLGHRLYGELTLAVDPSLSAFQIGKLNAEIRDHASGRIGALQSLVIETVPARKAGSSQPTP